MAGDRGRRYHIRKGIYYKKIMFSREAFTKQFFPVALTASAGTGIFPETIITAAILESSGQVNGTWYVGASKLANDYNNYFGIKAGTGWTGPTVNMKTGEYTPGGVPYNITDSFRAYPSVNDSFNDYVNFLKVNPRYTAAGVFTASNPYEQFQRLKDAGYATNPNYASLMTSVLNSIKKFIPPPGTTGIILGLALVLLFFLSKK